MEAISIFGEPTALPSRQGGPRPCRTYPYHGLFGVKLLPSGGGARPVAPREEPRSLS